MIKVLLAGTLSPKGAREQIHGGIITYCESLMNSSLKDKVELHFCETSASKSSRLERGRWKAGNFLDAGRNILQYWKVLRIVKPDLVHINTSYGASLLKHGVMVLLAHWTGCKVILQPHCSIQKVLPGGPTFLSRYALFIFRRCDGIQVLSKEWLDLREMVKCPVRYIPNGIDLKPYISMGRGEKRDGKTEVLYLGYLGEDKGTYDLIEAVARLKGKPCPSFTISLVGDVLTSNELPKIKKSLDEKQIVDYVSISPPVFGREKMDVFARADLLVLPSHHEGMPMTIIEAMAAGLPVIASHVGGIPDLVVPEQTGILVKAADCEALTEALAELISDQAKRLRFGEAGRARAKQCFDIDKKADETLNLYQSVMAKTR